MPGQATINKAFTSGAVIGLPLLNQYFADFNNPSKALRKRPDGVGYQQVGPPG